MNNSQDAQNANSGCFPSIMRWFLCSKSMPTHPSDRLTTESKPAELNEKDAQMINEAKVQSPANSATPGIVAKLMGLDSLPGKNNLNLYTESPDLVSRSRSVNFMDYLLRQQDETTQAMPHHRRLKTSVSFREAQKQSQELFVLFLHDDEETKKKGLKSKKSNVGFVELKHKREEKGDKKKNTSNKAKAKAINGQDSRNIARVKGVSKRVSQRHFNCNGNKNLGFPMPRKKVFDQKGEVSSSVSLTESPLKTIEQKEVSAESKLMKKKKQQPKKKKTNQSIKKAEQDGSYALSSADSVLDVDDFLVHYESELSECTQSMDLDTMKLSSSFQYIQAPNVDDQDVQASRSRGNKSGNAKEAEYYTELVDKLVKLTEEDIKEWNWMSTRMPKFEDFEEICVEIGQDILNLLLQQLVNELGFHAKEVEVF